MNWSVKRGTDSSQVVRTYPLCNDRVSTTWYQLINAFERNTGEPVLWAGVSVLREQQASLRYRLETLTTKDGWVFVATWRETCRCRRKKRRNIEADIVAGPHLLMHEDGCSSGSVRSSLLCRYCRRERPVLQVARGVLRILPRKAMMELIVAREERWNQHTHCTLTLRHTSGTAGSLESTREKGWVFFSRYPLQPSFSFSLSFRDRIPEQWFTT